METLIRGGYQCDPKWKVSGEKRAAVGGEKY